ENVREVLDVVDEYTQPGPARDRFYAHWYRGKGLHRLRGATWATKPDAHGLEVYTEIRKLALERFGPGVAAALPMKFRVLSRFVHADRVDLVSAQAHIERGIRSSIALTSIEWADSRLRLSLTSALTYANGTPIALEWRDEKVYWVPPEPLAGTSTILDADRDVTTEIERTKVAIVLRNRESLVEFEVLAKPTNPIGVDTTHVRDAQPTISLTADAEIDLSTVATGSELGIGVWDLFVYIESCGWSAIRRLSAAAFPMPEPDRAIELYTTKFGNLSIKVKDPIAEREAAERKVAEKQAAAKEVAERQAVERRAAQRQAAEKQAAKNAMLTPSATSNDARGVRVALIAGVRRFLSARVMRLARPAVRRVRRLRYVCVRSQVLDARCDGDRFTLRLAGAELNTLIAKPRSGGQSLRIRPSGGNPGLDSTFSVPLHHLLPRGMAHTTLDLYREERGKEIRIVSQRPSRCGREHDHEIAALPYTTASGNLSLSLLRTVRRGPLRIVVVVHQLNFSGGKTTAMFELASVLRAAGFDVTLTALWLTSTPPVYQPPEDVTLGYIDSQMLLTPGDESLRLVAPELSASPRTIRRIGTYFSEIDADVVYLPDYDSALYDIVLDAMPPQVLSIIGDHNPGRYGAALAQGSVPAKSERNRLFRAATQRFDAVHIINPIVQGAYEASTRRAVFCIPNSVAMGPSVGADFTKHRRIIAAGRLIPSKGFVDLIRAFARVRTTHPEWTLDIFGQGEMFEQLQALIRELELEGVVTIKGPTGSLLDEMLASSLHVSASSFESFGLTMAEAMTVGLPVLAQHRTAGAAYLLGEGRGFIAESGTEESLAARMDELLREIELRDPAGTIQQNVSAASHFVGQFSTESVIRSWKTEIYRLYDRKIASLYG
ncbi:MAG: glycosyltransferase, partial [Chloroflexota bacterium]|nr:glycosyltransferase [Chloroflexota bacterium]